MAVFIVSILFIVSTLFTISVFFIVSIAIVVFTVLLITMTSVVSVAGRCAVVVVMVTIAVVGLRRFSADPHERVGGLLSFRSIRRLGCVNR